MEEFVTSSIPLGIIYSSIWFSEARCHLSAIKTNKVCFLTKEHRYDNFQVIRPQVEDRQNFDIQVFYEWAFQPHAFWRPEVSTNLLKYTTNN